MFRWVPYTKAPNKCELNCMPTNDRFYYRHKKQVIDGTPCDDEKPDICVDGKCVVSFYIKYKEGGRRKIRTFSELKHVHMY